MSLLRSSFAPVVKRSFTTSARATSGAPLGFFQRPTTDVASTSKAQRNVARPHTPPHIPAAQSPNYDATWSETQQPRTEAMKGPRFEQINVELQPMPLSAMEMIQREPIRLVNTRVVACDGGDGPLGHPKVFINLDKPGPKACPYCGIRFERDAGHH